jgi:hypothetical protein
MSESPDLRSTAVSRCLEKKLLFIGYELADVLIIFLLLAALNLVFGRTDSKFLLVWLPTAALAVALRVVKRGKPDHFITHWVRFRINPRVLFAFYEPTARINPPRILKKSVKI